MSRFINNCIHARNAGKPIRNIRDDFRNVSDEKFHELLENRNRKVGAIEYWHVYVTSPDEKRYYDKRQWRRRKRVRPTSRGRC